MNRHPDPDTLAAFREHRLAGPVVVDVAHHIGDCARCASAALRRHLADEEIDALVDEPSKSSPHAETCAMCRAEVEDLRRFESGSELPHSRAPQRWLIAAAILSAVLALAALSLLTRRMVPDATPATASNPTAPVAPGTVAPAPPPPRVVASLADGGGRIALLEDGTIRGVELRSPRDADDARAALSGRALAIPTFIALMPGAVRGGSATAHPLRALEPFRSAVPDARPRFSWTPVSGAKSYRVAVFDADYEEIAQSEPLSGTSWTPSKPLPSGVDLSWHVVAETEAGEMSSAGSDRGEAVFRVLAPEEAAEVEAGAAHYRDSGLLRGLLYSRHGLLHDAEREYRRVAEQNPGSPIARALLDSISR